MCQHGRLLAAEGTERPKKASPEPPRLPVVNQRARKPRGPPKPVPGQQKVHAWPPPFSVHPRVPVFPSRFRIILTHPALSASLCCHSAAGLKPAPFSQEPGAGSRKRFMAGAGDTGRIHFPFPRPAPRVQPRSTQPVEQYPSSNRAYAIWHPFADTPQASTAASRSDKKRIQRIWRATQDNLNALTLF